MGRNQGGAGVIGDEIAEHVLDMELIDMGRGVSRLVNDQPATEGSRGCLAHVDGDLRVMSSFLAVSAGDGSCRKVPPTRGFAELAC